MVIFRDKSGNNHRCCQQNRACFVRYVPHLLAEAVTSSTYMYINTGQTYPTLVVIA